MHSCQDIEENRYFSNGGTNLHIHAIAQGRPEDNQVEFIEGPHVIVNPPKNLVLNNIRRFTVEHIGAANGLYPLAKKVFPEVKAALMFIEFKRVTSSCSILCHLKHVIS